MARITSEALTVHMSVGWYLNADKLAWHSSCCSESQRWLYGFSGNGSSINMIDDAPAIVLLSSTICIPLSGLSCCEGLIAHSDDPILDM